MGRLFEDKFQTTKHNMSYAEWQRILNYFNDRVKYGGSEKECKDLRMCVPFSCHISSKSQCRKTELLLTILSGWKFVTMHHGGKYTK